ncbi:MAG TPA: HAD family hydrolase [Ensifer sp.]|jgi:putative hydrolase of the HAD superfamily|uniref:HAD family hydrolase n=1 Tax=Ensifer sp. TaxID=1872086 RepID=UPI002E0FCC1F|nr:HAD family hydrolase [Ensifer sp.]
MSANERVLVFDLDDTLYLERDFVASGFKAVDAWLASHVGAEGFEGYCQAAAATGHSGRVFDMALAAMGLDADDALVSQLVAVYRGHEPGIALAGDARRYLDRPRIGRRAIITDGPAATQQAKVRALGLEALTDLVIYTDLWGRDFWKPHTRAYETVETWAAVSPDHLVYIADNPMKDFVTPRRRGWRTVMVARKERIHHVTAPDGAHEAETRISDLDALEDALRALAFGEAFSR